MKWTKGPLLGRGSTATVSLGILSGDIVAVKSSELSTSEPLEREQRIMSSLSCPYIVSYKGYDVSKGKTSLVYNIFLEYMPGGNLADAIAANGGFLGEQEIRVHTRQVLLGLDYLHSMGLAHCDIKSRNILIKDGGVKIADFGCAKRIESQGLTEGTPMFMAPEVARGEGQGLAGDVWALGCTIIEMATGGPPWKGAHDPVSVLYKIGYSGEAPDVPCWLSEEGKDFLGKCLRRDPEERWTATELLGHPFVVCGDEKVSCSPTGVLDHVFWSSIEEPNGWVSSLQNEVPVGDWMGSLDPTLIDAGPSWDRGEDEWVNVR